MKPEEKKAKAEFSRYVRLRDCMNTTGSLEYGKCFTCGKIVSFEASQCGHFVSGRSNSLFFVPNNSRMQCPECNTNKGGNLEVYEERLTNEIGAENVDKLKQLRHKTKRMYKDDYLMLCTKYKRATRKLTEESF